MQQVPRRVSSNIANPKLSNSNQNASVSTSQSDFNRWNGLVGLGKVLASIFGDTGLELPPEGAVIHLLTDQHQLIFAFAIPVAVIDREAFAS